MQFYNFTKNFHVQFSLLTGKFKSGLKNFETSLKALTSEELVNLLNSKDHENEMGSSEQEVISKADLDLLLDRSDLEKKWKNKIDKAEGKGG